MRKLGWLGLFFLIKLAVAVDYLPLWQAFHVSVKPQDQHSLWVKFDIAPEYHVYQNKIQIKTTAGSGVSLGKAVFPDPLIMKSPDAGTFKVYENKVAIQVPISNYGNGKLKIQVNYQGCKGLDLCFPEQQTDFSVDLNSVTTSGNNEIVANSANLHAVVAAAEETKPDSPFSGLFNLNTNASAVKDYFQHSSTLVIGGFFVLGLLIAFTPCVFPLLPVLLGVIAGKGISTRRSFSLALSYIFGGALMYAIAGVIAASLGYSLSGALQSVALNVALSVLFVIFALSLLGGFNLQLPMSWQNRLNQSMNKRNNGSLLSAMLIGGVSNLVLSPCVTAPLAGALVYISTTGNQLLGGLALFALGFGAGVPLLIIAVFGKRFLPKSGTWMILVKKLLGLVMVAMAIYQLSKVVPEIVVNYLSLALLLLAVWLIVSHVLAKQRRVFTLVSSSFLSLALIVGFAVSGQLQNIAPRSSEFMTVTNQAQLDKLLAEAKAKQQPVIMDYYAKWCVACKEMDAQTFANLQVSKLMSNYMRIRVDVTSNNSATQQLQQRYKVIAPPSMVFLDGRGQVLHSYQVTGFIASAQLSSSLSSILAKEPLATSACGNDYNKC